MQEKKGALSLTGCGIFYRTGFKEGHFATLTRLFYWSLNRTKARV